MHKKCIKSASNVHQNSIKNPSTLHQKCINNAPRYTHATTKTKPFKGGPAMIGRRVRLQGPMILALGFGPWAHGMALGPGPFRGPSKDRKKS